MRADALTGWRVALHHLFKKIIGGRTMAESKPLPHFIREVLGCRCSDAVLANIRLCPEPNQVAGVPLILCLDVDSRLLVYVVCPERPLVLIDSLQSEAGKRARDLDGFNRFRFVVGAASAGDAREKLMAVFQALPDIDDRQHLHVIDVQEIPT
jgi:hypothetical protein